MTLPTGRTATAVSTGDAFTCAILDDGSVWCWGYNDHGQLGVGNASSGTWSYSPSQTLIPAGRTAIAISTGYQSACAVLDNNSLVCWGSNNEGLLGDGTRTDRTTPVYSGGSIKFNSISYIFFQMIFTLYSLIFVK